MADSLFDNRYRYDYIYPRGRSGETLRAVDTQENDRPVVVKRPAPQDAPPIRSGQEVSILNERKALQRLSGHPALAEMVGSGQFTISGIVHQYIVVERATGAIVADMVRELATRGERLPELEMLVIVDGLLDLLHAAHAKEIVYNDVDAKHLFWDRETYHLKVIDWGNAVLLEGDESTPQGISRQSDVFQVGELLYFILTGGGRVDAPRDAGEDFTLNFGDDATRVSPRLQAIVSKAAHPGVRFRYRSIADLRKDLTEYRTPLQRERDGIVGRVLERLQTQRSKDELTTLLTTLEPALLMDPGYPEARRAFTLIDAQMSALEVAGDLDAARIYLESGNWRRAGELLDELRGKARGETARLVRVLRDWAHLLEHSDLRPTPLAVMDAISLAFDGEFVAATHGLLTQDATDDRVRWLGWLLAERAAAHAPDVIVLRPNLYRIELALDELAKEGQPVGEARALLDDIQNALDSLLDSGKGRRKKGATAATIHLVTLRDGYREIVDQLATLGAMLDSLPDADAIDRHLPPGALERAGNAAMTLADNMHVIGKQAVSSPRDARAALDSSRAIDPGYPAWDLIDKLLDGLYELLQSYQTYIPAADGSDLGDWLTGSAHDLKPFNERLFDEMLAGMIAGLEVAAEQWARYADAALLGAKADAVTALTAAIDAVSTVSPTLAGWLNQLRGVVNGASYAERYALHGALGRALADGWEQFDRGRLAEAERLASQAFDAARNELEQFACRRLRELSDTTRAWVERGGINDAKRTEAALQIVEQLFTAEERAVRQQFTAQMPSRDTYLKAMSRSLVDALARRGTAAVRLLFTGFVLQGAIDAYNDSLDTADFWREAALKTLPDAARHPITRALDEFVERRRDLIEAAETLNSVNQPGKLGSLDQTRAALESNRQAKVLTAGVYSLRELEAGVRDWADGEFRAAGIKLDNALKAIDEVETAAGITLTQYRAWLMELISGAAELHTQMRKMQQIIEAEADAPDDRLRAGHRHLVETTERLLGSSYATTQRQWRDSYDQFLAAYTDKNIRRSARLNRFNDLFRALFIDRHPAYPLYRHWYAVTDAASEFPAPPTDEPTPLLREEESAGDQEAWGSVRTTPGASLQDEDTPPRRGIPRALLIGVPLLIVVALIAFALLGGGNALTPNPSPSGSGETETAEALLAAGATDTPIPQTNTPSATRTPTVVAVLNTLPALPTNTATQAPTEAPSSTATASDTPTPTNTPTPTDTPIPSATPLPPEGVRGVQDALALVDDVAQPSWTVEQFAPSEEGDNIYRLGAGATTAGDLISVLLPTDLIDTRFGNNAPARISSMEADLLLQSYNPALLLDDEVYFGVVFLNAGDTAASAGIQINLVDAGIVNVGQLEDGVNSVVSQRSLGDVRLRLRLDRNPDTGNVTTFVNGEPVGLPLTLIAPQGVIPALFVRDGGVIVYVQSWTIVLR